MKHGLFALGLALLGLGLLAGCGGQGPAGTKVRVELSSWFGSRATAPVLYRTGDGPWRLAEQTDYGVYTLRVPGGETRFSVAVNCFPFNASLSTLGYLQVYELTLEDATELKVPCANLSSFTNHTFTTARVKAVTGETGYDHVWFHTLGHSRRGPLGSFANLSFLRQRDLDLLTVSYSDHTTKYIPSAIQRIQFIRNVDASSPPLSPLTVTLSNADLPSYAAVAGFSLPSWANAAPWFGVGFVSHKGLVLSYSATNPDQNPALGSGNDHGGRYVLVPHTEEGDVYCAAASAQDATRVYRASSLLVLDHAGGELRFRLPDTRFDPHVTAGTRPRFDWSSYAGADLYLFFLRDRGLTLRVLVTSAWLGANTSYTPPDLSTAPGLHGAQFLPGESVEWEAAALLTNRPLKALLAAEPLPLPNSLPKLPGLRIRMASKRGNYVVP